MDVSNSSKGTKPFEVNTRMVCALRASCGLGHAGLENGNFDKIYQTQSEVLLSLLADLIMNNDCK